MPPTEAPSVRSMIPVVNVHPEVRLLPLRRLLFVGLLGLRRIIIAPEPGERLGRFGVALRAVVAAGAEAEVEVVALHLQRVRHLDVLEWPASENVLQVLAAIAQPDTDVLARRFPDGERKDVAAVQLARVPLDAREAADAGEH